MKKLLIVFLLAACGTMKNREVHESLVSAVQKKDYSTAVKIANDKNFYPEQRSELLRLMESATAYYYAGMNYQALREFDKAKSLSDALYTKSLSAKVASAVDDNQSEFYGERFERSQIRFYQSLVHYKLGKAGKYEAWAEITDDGEIPHPEKILGDSEKRFHLNAAKNVMQEWNSLFAQYKKDTAGKPLYKSDLAAHLWGAFVHENGTGADRQTALALYRQAKEILFKNFNIYPAYNGKSEKFAADFAKLANMPEAKVKKDYVDPTAFGRELSEYIDGKIKRLSKNERDNFTVVIKDGLIAAKKSKQFKLEFNANEMAHLAYLGAYLTAAAGGSSQDVNNAAFITFATSYLLNGITYDIPYIAPQPAMEFSAVLIGSDGRRVDVPIALSSPLSDIAYNDINYKIGAERTVLAARLTAEYIAAAATAYFSYVAAKGAGGKDSPIGELIGIAAAVGTFKGLGAAIESSNKADLRQWRLLPSNIRIGSVRVDAGDWTLRVMAGGKVLFEQKVSVGDQGAFLDVNL